MKHIDLTGKQFGELTALYYTESGRWMCKCSCGKVYEVSGKSLRSGDIKSCGHTRSKFGDLTGRQFGEWTVELNLGAGKYLCKCLCGTERRISSTDLIYGKTKSCGHSRKAKDLTGMQIGEWKVLYKTTNYRYMCECSCGKQREINQSDLKNRKTLSCGHGKNKLIDLNGKKFGSWTVIGHMGYGRWLCECECGASKVIRHTELLNGQSKSCRCKQKESFRNTMLSRYGEIAYSKVSDERTLEQIQLAEDANKLKCAIQERFDHKPLIYELEPLMGLTYSRIIKIIHSFKLENIVNIYDSTSRYEQEIVNIILDMDKSLKIVKRAKIFAGSPRKEVDIYIPSKNIAIEFNGDYWHSELFKNKKYHQDKTIECAKLGIQLIHIFEYEWNDPVSKIKVINMLRNKILKQDKIYARACKIRKMESHSDELINFLNNNHLQGYSNCSIAYGLYVKSTLLGVITFGKPRYSNNFEYELIRLAFKQDINIVGGSERLFRAFISEYRPLSIISYCDISKFNGGVYTRLGFKTSISDITEPSYIWINFETGDILTRYETQKHKLIENNLGTKEQSESDIMHNIGYVKIYDCGNLRFTWKMDTDITDTGIKVG